MSKVALSLPFNPQLQRMADAVVAQMTQGNQRVFNGLHLRMEGDVGWYGKYGLAKVRQQRVPAYHCQDMALVVMGSRPVVVAAWTVVAVNVQGIGVADIDGLPSWAPAGLHCCILCRGVRSFGWAVAG